MEHSSAAIELEHAIGFSGLPTTLHYHPTSPHFVYSAGGTVCVQSFLDPHDQTFLRGHDQDIVCMCMSKSGRWFATGQGGTDSDVCVWDFERRELRFRLAEHGEC